MRKPVTIKDVARQAGVSISTVSRVLNGNAQVNQELQEKVLSAVQQMEYTPNEIARSLKSSNSKQIAFLVSNTDDHYFTSISRGIEKAIAPYNYNLIVCSTYFDLEKETAFLRSFQDRRISGIVINTVGNNDDAIAQMSKIVPTVLCSRMINSAKFSGDFVDFDSISGMFQLTQHLLNLGHRKIAVINGPRYLSTARERFHGFERAMLDAGIDISTNYPYIPPDCTEFSERCGYEVAEKIMQSKDRPTAVIATNGMTAVGAMRYFRTNNIRIPDEISFCCFDNIVHNDLFYIQPTHIYTDRLAMGYRIGSLMLERIHGEGSPINREIRLPTILIEGDSTRRIG